MVALMLASASLSDHVASVRALAGTPSPTLWYLTRTTAVSAYVALTVSVVLGTLRSIARKTSERLSWVVDELHQTMATLAGLLVVGHLLALRFDPFLPFTWINLLVPANEPYRPLPVIYGVFALYGLALLLFSSWIRRHVPYKLWRGVHYVSFVTFVLVTLHGWYAGSDSGEPWMRGIYAFASAFVVVLVLARLIFRAPASQAQTQQEASPRRAPAPQYRAQQGASPRPSRRPGRLA